MAQRDAEAVGGSGKGKQFNITVDGAVFHATTAVLTGAQIKALAGIDPAFGLFLEGHGGAADRPIPDGESVDLDARGREKFYSAPPATYGLV